MAKQRGVAVVALIALCTLWVSLLMPINARLVVAQEQFDCASNIVDGAHLFDGQTATVAQSIKELESRGPMVKVVTTQRFGDAGTLDKYVAGLAKQCPSWQPVNGGDFKNNLIVFAVSIDDREVGIYTGSIWTEVVTEKDRQTIQSHMGPYLADGQYVQAFTTGITEVGGYITQAASADQSQSQASSNQQPATSAHASTNSSGLDMMVIGQIVGVIVLIVVAGGVVYVSVRYTRMRLNVRRQRLSAIAQAQAQFNQAGTGLFDLNRAIDELEALVLSLKPNVAQDEFEALNQRYHGLNDQQRHLGATLSRQVEPSNDFSIEQGRQSLDQSTALNGAIAAALNDVHTAYAEMVVIEKAIQSLPQSLNQTTATIAQAKGVIAQAEQQGYLCLEAKTLHAQAVASLDKTQSSLKAKRIQDSMELLAKTEALLKTSMQSAQAQAEQEASLAERLRSARAYAVGLEGKIKLGRSVFDQLSLDYAESSWQPIKGNGSTAVSLYQQGLALLEEAQEKASRQHQQWSQASSQLDKATTPLTQAEVSIQAIFALKKELDLAKDRAAWEVNAAQTDIDKAYQYLEQKKGIVNRQHRLNANKAQKLAQQASSEMKKRKPDYLAVVKVAQQANHMADAILDQARGEYEAEMRLRASAKAALSNAAAAISTAANYIGSHSHTGSGSDSSLSEARRHLQKAERLSVTDARQIISMATQAQQQADRAYQQARAAQRRHEDEERRRRDRQNALVMGTAIGISSSHSSTSFSSFGGGGMSGSSSSFGGGGMSGTSSSW